MQDLILLFGQYAGCTVHVRLKSGREERGVLAATYESGVILHQLSTTLEVHEDVVKRVIFIPAPNIDILWVDFEEGDEDGEGE